MTIQELINQLSKYDLDIKVQLLINTRRGMQCVDVAEPIIFTTVTPNEVSESDTQTYKYEKACLLRQKDE